MSNYTRRLQELQPYQFCDRIYSIKLDANESPFELPIELKAELLSRLESLSLSRYPTSLEVVVRSKLAEFLGCSPDMLVLGNGSDELIHLVILAFGLGKNIYLPTPTFTMYRQNALVLGANPVEVPLTKEYQLDIGALLEAENSNPGITFLCSPNNPTGNLLSRADTNAILNGARGLVVVDEAYAEFTQSSMLPCVSGHGRLIVLRTLSKAYGLAGIRFGYGVMSDELRHELLKVKQPFNVNSLSLLAAELAIEHPEYCQAAVSKIVEERRRLAEQLAAIPQVKVYPSDTNFLLVRLARPALPVWEMLEKNGILVRYLGAALADCLRVSVGTPAENDAFVACLERILGGQEDLTDAASQG